MQASSAPVAAPWADGIHDDILAALRGEPSDELDLIELSLLATPHPAVYVHTDDREALDALILAGLISP
jgi:hypothetical protein